MRFGFAKTVASSALTRVITINGNVNNYNLYNSLLTTGWDGTKRLKVFVTINNGITIGSTSTSTAAFTVSGLRDTDFVQITNNGNIFGAGGGGGVGAATSAGTAGGAGGTALRTTSNIRIINNGIIGGGGGGSGAAGASRALSYYIPSCPSGGTLNGGGIGAAALVFTTCGHCTLNQYNAYAASCTPVYVYPAGANGAAGTAGSGLAGSAGSSPWFNGGAGGAAGNYYDGINKITIVTAGTVRGNTL